MAGGIISYIITDHARYQMKRRGISQAELHRVLVHPEQRLPVRKGRDVFQARVKMGDKDYLLRVFVDVDRTPAEVVTAYRTSKIEKYWRSAS